MEPRENDPSAHPAPPDGSSDDAPQVDEPAKEPVRVQPPPVTEVEMGGEAPCQLPRFWDGEG